jgi:hypothetical protein
MADDVREQLIRKINFIAIQFDKSTDVPNLAQFSCFVIYISHGFMKENTLFSKPVPGHAIAKCLFDLLRLQAAMASNGTNAQQYVVRCKGESWSEE